MTYKLVLKPEAEADVAGAYGWYESQRRGLGQDFMLCFEAALDSIHWNPVQYPKVHREVRRALVRRFPYGVFFVLEEGLVTVVAVRHSKRDSERVKGL